jgi:hypothetical protein
MTLIRETNNEGKDSMINAHGRARLPFSLIVYLFWEKHA